MFSAVRFPANGVTAFGCLAKPKQCFFTIEMPSYISFQFGLSKAASVFSSKSQLSLDSIYAVSPLSFIWPLKDGIVIIAN
jgi:hypothetical protein